MSYPIYSFVVPVHNEEETLPELYRRMADLLARLDGESEVILVDDGSTDRSYPLMVDIHGKDPRFKIIHFSRNFGHQIAISAGMDHACGSATVIMDADLQDPPEIILQMIERWKDGYEVVYGVREERLGESWFKRTTAKRFYRSLRRLTDVDIPSDVGDFRLIDRKALDAFKGLRETNRYVRGMFSWIGFRQTGVSYVRAGRFAGETKYPLRKMLRLAVNGVVSFSNVPLRLALNLGFLIAALSIVTAVVAIALKLSGAYAVSGWTSMFVTVAFIGGIQLMVLGVIGEYISRIYDQVKERPLYITREVHGIAVTDGSSASGPDVRL